MAEASTLGRLVNRTRRRTGYRPHRPRNGRRRSARRDAIPRSVARQHCAQPGTGQGRSARESVSGRHVTSGPRPTIGTAGPRRAPSTGRAAPISHHHHKPIGVRRCGTSARPASRRTRPTWVRGRYRLRAAFRATRSRDSRVDPRCAAAMVGTSGRCRRGKVDRHQRRHQYRDEIRHAVAGVGPGPSVAGRGA